MASQLKIPLLANRQITIKVTTHQNEIADANQLVCCNYVASGIWTDEQTFLDNKIVHSSRRTVFVAMEDTTVIGTISIVLDSERGLPADQFQPDTMQNLRDRGDFMGEASALAIDPSWRTREPALILFLYKYLYQYAFFYAGVDRLIATCTPKHARFYETVFGFQRISSPASYSYVKVSAQLLTVHLVEDRVPMATRYGVQREQRGGETRDFYHFLLVDEHPALHFPDKKFMKRPRDKDWLAEAKRIAMPIAV